MASDLLFAEQWPRAAHPEKWWRRMERARFEIMRLESQGKYLLYPNFTLLPKSKSQGTYLLYPNFALLPKLYPSTQTLPLYPNFTLLPNLYPYTLNWTYELRQLYPFTQTLPFYPNFTLLPQLYPFTQTLPQSTLLPGYPLPLYPNFTPLPKLYPFTKTLPFYAKLNVGINTTLPFYPNFTLYPSEDKGFNDFAWIILCVCLVSSMQYIIFI